MALLVGRRLRVTGDVCAELQEPGGEPGAFKAGVSGDEYLFIFVEISKHRAVLLDGGASPSLQGASFFSHMLIKLIDVFFHIHAFPELVVLISHKLAILSGAFQGLAFENARIAVDILKEAGLHDEEARVDPAFTANRFFAEGLDLIGLWSLSTTPNRADGRAMVMVTSFPWLT